MKVFLVVWSYDSVKGVFSTREKADLYIKASDLPKDAFEVYEYEVNNPDYQEAL